ncbi:hypothetical protein LIT13_14425, partial [Flavobacterium psychrophilum]|uniref:hypothetical protein n=1 Tax=Flavobacterium psychrophilum TaxID=96345 RepID=UPI001D0777D5
SRKGRVGLCATIFFIGEKPQKKDFRCYPSRGAAHQHSAFKILTQLFPKTNKSIFFNLSNPCHLRCKPQTANAIIQNPLKNKDTRVIRFNIP